MKKEILKNKCIVPESDFIVKETIADYTFFIEEDKVLMYGVKETDITNYFNPYLETKVISLTKQLALIYYNEKLCDNYNLEDDVVYHFLELAKPKQNIEKEKIIQILCFENREDRTKAIVFLNAVYDYTLNDDQIIFIDKGLKNENTNK